MATSTQPALHRGPAHRLGNGGGGAAGAMPMVGAEARPFYPGPCTICQLAAFTQKYSAVDVRLRVPNATARPGAANANANAARRVAEQDGWCTAVAMPPFERVAHVAAHHTAAPQPQGAQDSKVGKEISKRFVGAASEN